MVVAHEHVLPAHFELAAWCDAHRRPRHGLPHSADLIVSHARERERCRRFGQAVALDHRQSDAVEEMQQVKRDRRAARSEVLDLRAERAADRAVHARLIHGVFGSLFRSRAFPRLLHRRPFDRRLGRFGEHAAFPAGAGFARCRVVHFLEHAGYAEQERRLEHLHVAGECLRVRQIPDHAFRGADCEVLDHARKAVGERQEQQQARLAGDRPGQTVLGRARDAREVAVGELGAFRCAGRTGGVDDRRQVVGVHGADPLVELLVGDHDAEPLKGVDGMRVEHEDAFKRVAGVEHGVEPVEAFLIVCDRQFDRRIIEDALRLRRGIGVVDRHGHRANGRQREVEQAPFDACRREDADRVSLADAELDEALGDRAHMVVELHGGHRAPRAIGLLVLRERRVLRAVCQACGEQRVDGGVVVHGECGAGRGEFSEHERVSCRCIRLRSLRHRNCVRGGARCAKGQDTRRALCSSIQHRGPLCLMLWFSPQGSVARAEFLLDWPLDSCSLTGPVFGL